MKDFLGKQIKPGCTIVYPVRRGSSMWLTKAIVDSVDKDTINCINDKNRRVTVKTCSRCVIVEI